MGRAPHPETLTHSQSGPRHSDQRLCSRRSSLLTSPSTPRLTIPGVGLRRAKQIEQLVGLIQRIQQNRRVRPTERRKDAEPSPARRPTEVRCTTRRSKAAPPQGHSAAPAPRHPTQRIPKYPERARRREQMPGALAAHASATWLPNRDHHVRLPPTRSAPPARDRADPAAQPRPER